jgi:hypothetical protein
MAALRPPMPAPIMATFRGRSLSSLAVSGEAVGKDPGGTFAGGAILAKNAGLWGTKDNEMNCSRGGGDF